MIQTHLLKLDAPYPVLFHNGIFARHLATLIEVKENADGKLETTSYPVIAYNDKAYAGTVWDTTNLEDCTVLDAEISMFDYWQMVADSQRDERRGILRTVWPEMLTSQMRNFGISMKWPKKMDADGLETDEDEDRIVI